MSEIIVEIETLQRRVRELERERDAPLKISSIQAMYPLGEDRVALEIEIVYGADSHTVEAEFTKAEWKQVADGRGFMRF